MSLVCALNGDRNMSRSCDTAAVSRRDPSADKSLSERWLSCEIARRRRANFQRESVGSRILVRFFMASALAFSVSPFASANHRDSFVNVNARRSRYVCFGDLVGGRRQDRLRGVIAVAAAPKKISTPGDLHSCTVDQLKAMLRERGLPVSGRKADLITRLQTADKDDDQPKAEQEEKDNEPEVVEEEVDEEEEAQQQMEEVVPTQSKKLAATTPPTTKAKAAPTSPAVSKSFVVRPIKNGDTVYLKAWTGKYFDVSEHHADVKARGIERGVKEAMIIEKTSGDEIRAGDTIFLKSKKRDEHIDLLGSAVRVRYNDHGQWQQLRITRQAGEGVVQSGDTVFLRGHQEMIIDVQDIDVKARWPDEGDWQQLVLEVDG